VVVVWPTTWRIGAGCFWVAAAVFVVTFDVDLLVVAEVAFATDVDEPAKDVDAVSPATVELVSPGTIVVDSSADVTAVVAVVAEVAFFPEPPPHAAAMTATAVAAVTRRQLVRDRMVLPPRTRGLSTDPGPFSARRIV
jgi:hypothetical protein